MFPINNNNPNEQQTRNTRAHVNGRSDGRAAEGETTAAGKHENAGSIDLAVATLESAPDPVYLIRPDGGVAYTNDAACRSIGYTSEELLRMRLSDIDPDWTDERWQQQGPALLGIRATRTTSRHRKSDGRLLPVDLHMVPVSVGGIVHLCMFVRDMTDHAVRLAELNRLNHTLEAAQTVAKLGCWRIDPAADSAEWSSQMFEIFDLDPAQGPPRYSDHSRFVHKEDWPHLDAAVQGCAADGTPFDMLVRICRHDGSMRHLSLRGVALRDAAENIVEVLVTSQDVTDLKAAEEALRRSEAEYRLLLDHLNDLVVKLDRQGRVLFASPSYIRTFGSCYRDTLDAPTFSPIVHEDDAAKTAASLETVLRSPFACHCEHRALTEAGWRWLDWSGSAMLDHTGQVIAIIGVGRDITERKRAEDAAIEANERLRIALEGGEIGLYSAELPEGRISADERYLAMLGYAPGELGLDFERWLSLVHPNDREDVETRVRLIFNGETDRFEAEYRMRHRQGHWVWIMDRAQVFHRDAAGNPTRTAGTHLDVTRRKAAELKLEYLVDHDDLTGLLNRRGIWQTVKRIHAASARSGDPYCLAMLDLDFFKQVNDTYGHAAGDRVLVKIAKRLRDCVRQADWVGRWGGEEFVVVLPGATEAQSLVTLERLRSEVSGQPIGFEDKDIHVTMSGGMAVCLPADGSPDDVLDRADGALYRAKTGGRDRICYNGTHSGAHAVSMAVLVQDALRTAGILPAFQPIVELKGRTVVGEEALARIIDADGQVLTAASFIDVAQQLGLLHRIDRMLFRSALFRFEQRGKPVAGTSAPIEFIHLSGDLLRHAKTIEELAEQLKQTTLEPNRPNPLVLTISERQIAAGASQITDALAPLLDLGCRLAVGGFGGEASSLRFVTRLPIGFMDIDGTLIKLAGESSRARSILTAILASAHELGVTTIAKQVEDADTADRLMDLGIDWAQGYLFGHPSTPMRGEEMRGGETHPG
jgi:diguanylate cyclase (GGDEF)-like protein/PAS domain S-box-containing protein